MMQLFGGRVKAQPRPVAEEGSSTECREGSSFDCSPTSSVFSVYTGSAHFAKVQASSFQIHLLLGLPHRNHHSYGTVGTVKNILNMPIPFSFFHIIKYAL